MQQGDLVMNVLFCADPMNKKTIDEAYSSEYKEAKKLFPCSLFSYEDIECGKLSIYGDIEGETLYRGWMMRPELYRRFYEKLTARGISLVNTPEEYERYHLLPNWYSDFKDYTPGTAWTDTPRVDEAMDLVSENSGPFIVKDYVKSRKHQWNDACYISQIEDAAEARRVISNFVVRQGADLVGGIVLRRYEKFRIVDRHEKSGMPVAEEYRCFVFKGQKISIDGYWNGQDKNILSEKEMAWLDGMIARIRSNFVSVDLARKESSELMIVELGDGQVSGLQQLEAGRFYRRLDEIIGVRDTE